MGVIGIIFEARHTFQCRLDDPYLQNMPLKQPPDIFGSQQMIRLLIEQFLIHLARRYSASYTSVVRPKDTIPAAKSTKSKNDIEVYSLVTEYMKEHIRSHVTIEQICKDNLVGRSRLQKIFKNQCGLGIIDYFSKLKINTAKELIRSRHMNFTQISDYLGYTSIHYFSRQFKKETGITLGDYIVRCRLKKAQELLECGCSVQKAAEVSGFGNYAHFIRTFTRHTGISPGKYGRRT